MPECLAESSINLRVVFLLFINYQSQIQANIVYKDKIKKKKKLMTKVKNSPEKKINRNTIKIHVTFSHMKSIVI
jgi:hypothetical protein